MILAGWRADLNAALGERVFLDALRDYASGNLRRRQASLLWAGLLAGLVLLTPLIVLAAGLAIVISALPSLGGLFFGGILIATGLFLWPARFRMPKDTLIRQTAPQLFTQLDTVCAALDAPLVTHVTIIEDFNAFVTTSGRHRVLGLGAMLWQAATPVERLALVGHEIAHLVNDDPARGRVVGKALETLEKWERLLAPDTYQADNVIGEILTSPFRFVAAGLEQLMTRLLYLDSQRAEYLADALAAEVAGPDAVIRLMETLSLGDHMGAEWTKAHGLAGLRGRAVLEWLVATLTGLDDVVRKGLLDDMVTQKLSIDSSHPPTAYRIGFIKALPGQKPRLSADIFATEDAALSRRLDQTGERLEAFFEIQ